MYPDILLTMFPVAQASSADYVASRYNHRGVQHRAYRKTTLQIVLQLHTKSSRPEASNCRSVLLLPYDIGRTPTYESTKNDHLNGCAIALRTTLNRVG